MFTFQRSRIVIVLLLLLAPILIICGSLNMAAPVYSDNATSINLTILSPDFSSIPGTFSDLHQDIQDLNKNLSDFNTYVIYFLEMVLVLALLFASIWKKEPYLYGVTSLITIFIGYLWVKLYPPIGVCVLALSSYELFEAIWLAFFKKSENGKEKEE